MAHSHIKNLEPCLFVAHACKLSGLSCLQRESLKLDVTGVKYSSNLENMRNVFSPIHEQLLGRGWIKK